MSDLSKEFQSEQVVKSAKGIIEPETTVEQQSLWSAIREALRGSHRDYTDGPIGRSILLLAIPMVL